MPVIQLTTIIHAPIARCFDLARSVDLHLASAEQTGERAVAGVTSGLLGLDDEVTWQAKHFGIWQRLTSRITAYQPPSYFRDSMVSGAFARFDHDHWFEARDGATTAMTDAFDFDTPLGILGRAANALFLTRHMQAFLAARNAVLKRVAESDEWRNLLANADA